MLVLKKQGQVCTASKSVHKKYNQGLDCEQGNMGLPWLWPAVTTSLHFIFPSHKYLLGSTTWYSLDAREFGNCCLGKSMRQARPNTINDGTANYHIRFQTYWVHWKKNVLHKASITDTAQHNYINLLLFSSQFPKSFQGLETSFFLVCF